VEVPPSVFPTPIAPKCSPIKAAKPTVYHACREGDRERVQLAFTFYNAILQKKTDGSYTKVVHDQYPLCVPPAVLRSSVAVRRLPGFHVLLAVWSLYLSSPWSVTSLCAPTDLDIPYMYRPLAHYWTPILCSIDRSEHTNNAPLHNSERSLR
jgi:hypothetical protein